MTGSTLGEMCPDFSVTPLVKNLHVRLAKIWTAPETMPAAALLSFPTSLWYTF